MGSLSLTLTVLWAVVARARPWPATTDSHMDKVWRDAVRRGNVGRLRELLDLGADINARDRYGQTGPMIAARAGQSNVVRFLIERGARLDHTAKYGLSAVMLAVLNGHVEIVRLLVQAGANLELRGTEAPSFHGNTALDLAEARRDSTMVEVLRSRASP